MKGHFSRTITQLLHRPGVCESVSNGFAQNKKCTVILIVSRIPADKTLVSTDKSYNFVWNFVNISDNRFLQGEKNTYSCYCIKSL
jgi:hypothetical protein